MKLCVLMLVLFAVTQIEADPDVSCDALLDKSNATYAIITPVMEKHDVALLLLLGFGGFSILLAILYNTIRKKVFHDAGDLDTTFDAGGNVSTSLTAVTIATQFLWPGDLLEGPTLSVLYGVGGSYWFMSGFAINVVLFPILSQQFKIRAPGAKTFLQLIYARFGKEAHILFTVFAIILNLLIVTVLLVSGMAVFQAITKDASPEFCLLLIATLCGSYSFVGGLGTTFYVSFFNTGLVFVIVVIVVYNLFYSNREMLGSYDELYTQLSCLGAPEGNVGNSYLSFTTEGGFVWFVQGVFGAAAIFSDQATWQSRIAAKPIQGIIGYFLGTCMWLSTTSVMSLTGLVYLAVSSGNSSMSLPPADIGAGLAMPFIIEKILGYSGAVIVLTLFTMALMSTGSGELMAAASIIVYDIYQTHINPFRKDHSLLNCLLCGEMMRTNQDSTKTDQQQTAFCSCPPPGECPQCANDKINFREKKLSYQEVFTCEHHGPYQRYQDTLVQFKSWCILWVTLGLIPLGLLINVSGVDLYWIFMAGFTLTTPCFPASLLTIMWVKATKQGVISGKLDMCKTTGTVAGLATGIAGLLSVASTYEGGLNDFLANTSQHYSAIAGTGCGFVVSLSVTVIVSLFTHGIKDSEAELMEWQKLRDIDNPLSPWADMFRDDLPQLAGARPSSEQLNSLFRRAKWVAYVGGAITMLLFVVLIPSVMIPMGVLTSSQFTGYLLTLQISCFLIVGGVVFITPVEEAMVILKEIRKRKRSEKAKPPSKGAEHNIGNEML